MIGTGIKRKMRDGRCLGMHRLPVQVSRGQKKDNCVIHTAHAVMFLFVVNCMVSCGWRVWGEECLGQGLRRARSVDFLKHRSSSKVALLCNKTKQLGSSHS